MAAYDDPATIGAGVGGLVGGPGGALFGGLAGGAIDYSQWNNQRWSDFSSAVSNQMQSVSLLTKMGIPHDDIQTYLNTGSLPSNAQVELNNRLQSIFSTAYESGKNVNDNGQTMWSSVAQQMGVDANTAKGFMTSFGVTSDTLQSWATAADKAPQATASSRTSHTMGSMRPIGSPPPPNPPPGPPPDTSNVNSSTIDTTGANLLSDASNLDQLAQDYLSKNSDLTGYLWKVMQGQVPSAAEQQLYAGLAHQEASIQSNAVGAMGFGESAGLANHLAAQQGNAAMLNTNQAAGQLRAQESVTAAGQIGQNNLGAANVMTSAANALTSSGVNSQMASLQAQLGVLGINTNATTAQDQMKNSQLLQQLVNSGQITAIQANAAVSLIGGAFSAAGLVGATWLKQPPSVSPAQTTPTPTDTSGNPGQPGTGGTYTDPYSPNGSGTLSNPFAPPPDTSGGIYGPTPSGGNLDSGSSGNGPDYATTISSGTV